MRQPLKSFLVAATLLAIMAAPAFSAFNPNTDESLVGWWPLNDGSGTVASDASGNGNDGDLEGDPTWVTGVLGGALELDGDDYVDTGNDEQLAEYSFAIWVMSPEAPSGDSPSGPLHREQNYQINWNHSSGSSWQGSAAMNAGGWMALKFDDLYADTWYHLASTFDGSEWITYQDGEQVNSTTVSSSITTETNTLKIGRHAAASQYFTGTVDDARVYSRALTAAEIRDVMYGGEDPALASMPSPGDGEEDVALDASLSWTAGIYAVSHDVYMGTNFDDVNDADRTSDLLVSQEQGDTTYTPDELVLDGQYYWRVDEVNEDPSVVFKGNVWGFTAEPTYLYPTPVEVLASSYDVSASDYNCIPENTINGSGMVDGLHSVQPGDMWRTANGEADGAWIQYEFDVAYQFNQLLVWNYNEAYEAFIGIGVKDAEIQTSMDGETWTTAATVELTQCNTNVATAVTSTVDLGGPVAKFVRINILSKWGAFQAKVGLSEVQFEAIPLAARRPSPKSGVTAESLFNDLVWRLGRGAELSQLYLSTDANLVAAGDASALIDDGISGRSYPIADTGALYGETYYWRIDEVAGDQVTAGAVWDFNTPDHLVVDDMEAYGYSNWIYETWLDGFDENLNNRDDNGSEIGDAEPYVEQEISFGGSQSLPMFYDNTHGEDAAWVELAVDSEIFSVGGVEQFSVLFMGERGNTGGQFYVSIGNQTVTSEASLTSGVWTQMIVDLSEFGNLNSATTLILGVAGSGEEGVVYIDDVCLYREAPLLAAAQAVEPSDDGLVVYYQMEDNLNDSAGSRDGQSTTTLFYDNSLSEGALSLGRALSLEGLEDSYVDVNDVMGDLVASLTDSTYAAWVKLAEDSEQSWMRVFDFGTGTDAYMFLTPRSGTDGSPEFGILSPDSASAVEQDVAGSSMLTSDWHHLAVTIEQGDPNGTLTLYVDGVVVDTDETDTLPADLGETTNNWLGRSQWSSDGYFEGLMDEVRIYDRALSEGEIRWLAGDQ